VRLVVEGLRRRFGDRDVLDGVSFEIAASETVALMGPSGCGKTTLLQIIGLLDRPDGGRVVLGDHEPWSAPSALRAELRLTWLGFVFQRGNLIDHLSARENVALPACAPGSRARRRSRARTSCSRRSAWRVEAMRHRTCSRSARPSGSPSRRTGQPAAADPGRRADGEPRRRVFSVGARGAARAREAAVLLVTHDPDVAARTGRTLHLRDGKLGERA